MPLMEHGPLLPRGWRETNQPTLPLFYPNDVMHKKNAADGERSVNYCELATS